MEEKLGRTERIDELNGRGYRIIQDSDGFCFGLDAVLLSSFAIVEEGDRVLDLGTGTGVIPILLEAKTRGSHFTGLEIQEDVADMARRSVRLNGIEEKVEIVTGDIKEASGLFRKSSFDVITANPPYMPHTDGLLSPNRRKAISRHEICCKLEDVVREAAALLRPGGRFYMVHRPCRLTEIFGVMAQYHLAVRFMRLVYPYADKEANLVLVEGIRGGNNQTIVEKPCIVFSQENLYTKEAHEIYFNERLMEHSPGNRKGA